MTGLGENFEFLQSSGSGLSPARSGAFDYSRANVQLVGRLSIRNKSYRTSLPTLLRSPESNGKSFSSPLFAKLPSHRLKIYAMEPGSCSTIQQQQKISLYLVFNVGFGLLTFNAYASFILPGDDLWTLSFFIYASAFALLMFLCLYLFDRSPENLENRERLKILIWVLGAILVCTSARWIMMAGVGNITVLVWAFAWSTCLLSFYFFFINGQDSSCGDESGGDEALPAEEV